MRETQAPFRTDWWKFDRYEIVDRVIVPAPDAKKTTFPAYDRTNTKARKNADSKARPLFEDLFRLLVRPAEETGKPLKVSYHTPSDEEVLKWCSRHGLLGLLLHRTISVDFPPALHPYNPISGGFPSPRPPEALVPTQRRATRMGTGWSVASVQDPAATGWEWDGMREGLPLPRPPKSTLLRPPSVLQYRIDGFGTELRPFEKVWPHYFPRLDPQQDEYPLPGEERFEREYGEYVSDLQEAARALLWAFQMDIADEGADPMTKVSDDTYTFLDGLLGPLRVAARPLDPIGSTIEVVSPSLFTTYALVAAEDLLASRFPMPCQHSTCGRWFYPSRGDSKYCPAPAGCKNAAYAERKRKGNTTRKRNIKKTAARRSHTKSGPRATRSR